MTDEIVAPQEVPAAEAAPEQIETASTATEETTPEQIAQENSEEVKQEAKTFTQEELDAAIGKRLAREQRKWEREQAQRQAEMQMRAPQVELNQMEFESPEAYAEALALQKAEEIAMQREEARRAAQIREAFHEREEEARNKYEDFEQVAYSPNLPITDVMAHTIQASEVGPDIAYFLGTNPKEADRISRLSPFLQAKEIGRIEAKIANEPPKPTKTTSAPPPIAPVAPKGAAAPSYDTTDPRSTKSMSTSDWIAAERERQRKKWAAQHSR